MISLKYNVSNFLISAMHQISAAIFSHKICHSGRYQSVNNIDHTTTECHKWMQIFGFKFMSAALFLLHTHMTYL